MKDRIIQIMENEGLTPSKFAESIGIQRAAMSHIISGRNNPSLDVIIKILTRFPYINSNWLLFGKGVMILEKRSNEPDLFENTSLFQSDSTEVPEYLKEIRSKKVVINDKSPNIENVMMSKVPEKTVTKIMLFYSDNTFDTFISEKTKKE